MSEVTSSKLDGDDMLRAPGAQYNRGPVPMGGEEDDDDEGTSGKQQKERRKIEIKFIQDKSRRHITFSKRKAGIMKKAYELSVLTGTQVLLLVVSETGLVYTFTTPKLQPLVTKSEGKNLIQACLNAPEEGLGENGSDGLEGGSGDSPEPAPQQRPVPQQMPVPQQQQQQQLPQAHMPHGMPYQGQTHPQGGLPMPQSSYNDPYHFFGNMPNGNMPNQQQYQ